VRPLSSGPSSFTQDEVTFLRESLHQSRAQAESLRLDLGDATALIEGLEAELSSITTRWHNSDRELYDASAMDLLIRVRTQVRRALVQELGPESVEQAGALRDLRIAEVCFRFLLGLRSLQVSGFSSPERTPSS
jgi:hypothetical protein